MKERILRLVDEIREHLSNIDDAGIDQKIMQDIMDNLSIIEDELYDDDISSLGFTNDDYEE